MDRFIVDGLKAEYAGGRLILFCGAGISKAGGLPSWLELSQALLERVQQCGCAPYVIDELRHMLAQGHLIKLMSAAKRALGSNEFYLQIEQSLDDAALPVPDIACAIAELESGLRAILTTNLDRFLERALPQTWEVLDSLPPDCARRARYVLKLHGTRTDRRTWVFDQADYDDATFGRPSERAVLDALFKSYPLLFVGYGLQDYDLDFALGATRALAGPQPPIHYALVPSTIGPYRRNELGAAGIRLLEYDRHEDVPVFLRSLSAVVEARPLRPHLDAQPPAIVSRQPHDPSSTSASRVPQRASSPAIATGAPQAYGIRFKNLWGAAIVVTVAAASYWYFWWRPSALCDDEYGIGNNQLAQQHFDEAFRHFAAATEICPSRAQAWSGLGSAQFQQQDFNGAVESFRRARRLAPHDLEYQFNLAAAYLARKDTVPALQLLKDLVTRDPTDKWSMEHLGLAYQRLGEFAPMEAAYRAVIEPINQHSEAAAFNLAAAYAERAKNCDDPAAAQAVALIQKSVELAQLNHDLDARLRQLNGQQVSENAEKLAGIRACDAFQRVLAPYR